MTRVFLIVHTLGMNRVAAEDACAALRKACVPGGYTHALGIIDGDYIRGGPEMMGTAGPFLGFIGQPAALAKGGK